MRLVLIALVVALWGVVLWAPRPALGQDSAVDALQNRFTVLLGSPQAAAQQLAAVRSIADRTGYTFDTLAAISVQLTGTAQAAGLKLEQSNQLLYSGSSAWK